MFTHAASLPPLVPAVQWTKSLRKALSLEVQLKGRLPARAWLMEGLFAKAKPLLSREECTENIWRREKELFMVKCTITL